MKDLNLGLYMSLGDLDANEIGEKSSHTSRGMGVYMNSKKIFLAYNTYQTPCMASGHQSTMEGTPLTNWLVKKIWWIHHLIGNFVLITNLQKKLKYSNK